jgi:RNA polymerase sigma-70 factor (ECF subfamily)
MKTELLNKKKISSLTDEEIIAEIKLGNIDCFSEIIRRYNQRLYRIAISYGISDDDCDDVIQLAYISAYEKMSQFRGVAKFSTWLSKILINECLMLKRKTKKFISISELDSVTIPLTDHQNPENHYMRREQKEILEKVITDLPEKYRTTYILKEVEGLSIKEISEILLISSVNVKVRIHRAKALLKNYIKEITDISSLFTFGNERCDAINIKVMNYIRSRKEFNKV